MAITANEYEMLDRAYKFFNSKLFDTKLPDCLIVLSTKGGRKNLGSYCPELYAPRNEKAVNEQKLVDEIVLNPANYAGRSDRDILSTLAHEMAHLHQQHFSKHKPSKFGYHDKSWGTEMKRIGLYPSNTGEVGGKETGRQMTHYIVEGGLFDVNCAKFLEKNAIGWASLEFNSMKTTKKSNTVKYICPGCGAKFRAKIGLNVTCTDCEIPFENE